MWKLIALSTVPAAVVIVLSYLLSQYGFYDLSHMHPFCATTVS
jgi:hypothetical protein